MTDETPLPPSEFAEAVEDYASNVGDERYVHVAYAAQLAATSPAIDRTPLDADEFVAWIITDAGVDVDPLDRERIEQAYQQQIETVHRAGDLG